MGIKRGSITTSVVADGLVFNMDPANRASFLPSTNTITGFNTIDTNISGAFSSTGIWDSSTTTPTLAIDGTGDQISINKELANQFGSNYTGDITMCAWFSTSTGYASSGGNSPILALGTSAFASGKRSIGGNGSVGLKFGMHRTQYSNQGLEITWDQSLTSTSYGTGLGGKDEFIYITFISPYLGTGANLTLSDFTSAGGNIYINGISITDNVTINTNTGALSYDFSNQTSNIGNNIKNSNIGPCHIYNRALSANEVLHNYNALKGRFGLT